MRFRFLYPPKGNPVIELEETQPFSLLLKQAAELTGWPEESIILKNGFPPSTINARPSQSVGEILRSEDGIIIQKKSDSPYQAASPLAPPKKLRAENPNISRSSGSTIATLSNTPIKANTKPSRKRSRLEFGESSEDWGTSLIDIFSKSSGNLNSAEKAVRGAFRNAVQRRHCSTIAEKRWAAVQGNSYKLELLQNYKFKVSYPFGPRSKRSEEYTALPKELLTLVIREAYMNAEESKMNLRPYYLAEAQPMIFWNMVRLYTGDIFNGYLEMLPELDWSFIEDRHRELSEKAKENLRQKKEADEYREIEKTKRMKGIEKKRAAALSSEASTQHSCGAE